MTDSNHEISYEFSNNRSPRTSGSIKIGFIETELAGVDFTCI